MKIEPAKVQVRVTEPEVAVAVRVTLSALIEHAAPPSCTRAMVPVKPFIAATLIVDVPGVPAFTVTEGGKAVTEKSGTTAL